VSKLRRRGLADDDRSRVLKLASHGAIGVWDPVLKGVGAKRCSVPFGRCRVFQGDRNAVEWAQGLPRRRCVGGRLRGRSCLVVPDEAEGVQLAVDLVDSLQRVVDEFDGRELAGSDGRCHVGCG